MSIDKMREDFEAEMNDECISSGQQLPDLSLSPCVLDDGSVIYRNSLTQACWWAYRKGWQASRESLVIELPSDQCIEIHGYSPRCTKLYCQKAIEDAGFKVTP